MSTADLEVQVSSRPSHNDGQSLRCADSPHRIVELQVEHKSPVTFVSVLTRNLKWIRDVGTTQEHLGHRSVEMTMIYTHVLNRDGRGAWIRPASINGLGGRRAPR